MQTHVIRKLINMFIMTCSFVSLENKTYISKLYTFPSQPVNKLSLLHHYVLRTPSFSSGCLCEYSRTAIKLVLFKAQETMHIHKQCICYILTKINQKLIAPLQKNNLSVFKKKKELYFWWFHNAAWHHMFHLRWGFFSVLFFFPLEGLEQALLCMNSESTSQPKVADLSG